MLSNFYIGPSKFNQDYFSISSLHNLPDDKHILNTKNLLEFISFIPRPNVILEYDTQCLLPSQ